MRNAIQASEDMADERWRGKRRLKMDRDEVGARDLAAWQREALWLLQKGFLLRHASDAVAAFHHYKHRWPRCSTPCVTRFLLNESGEPDVAAFFSAC